MILGFKDRFVPLILDGRKTQTIRAGNRWMVGMRADLYSHPRQKNMTLLGRRRVIAVESIVISWRATGPDARFRVVLNNYELAPDELQTLARCDGFSDLADMARFWRRRLPFSGQLIHWSNL